MGLLEKAKSLKDASAHEKDHDLDDLVIADVSLSEDNTVIVGNTIDDEGFHTAEVLHIDDEDGVLSESRSERPVKTDDIIITDDSTDHEDGYIRYVSSDDSVSEDNFGETGPNIDVDLDEFLSREEVEPESVSTFNDMPDPAALEQIDEPIVLNEETDDMNIQSERVLDELNELEDLNISSSVPAIDPDPLPPKVNFAESREDFESIGASGEFSAVLLEATRELMRSQSADDFFNVLLLLIMGQFTASSVAIITPVHDEEPQGKWILRDIRGIRLKSRSVTFRGVDPLMGHLLECKTVVDIDEYSSLEGFREECSLFNSIGARYVIPIAVKGLSRALVALGEKISDEYTSEEIEEMRKYAVAVSTVYERLLEFEKIIEENRQYVERNKEYSDIDKIERDLRRSSGGADIESVIEEKMKYYGAESYCFFIRNERGDNLVPRMCEKEDLMGLKLSGYVLPANSELCSYFIQKDDWEDFENPASFNPLRSVFTDTHIIKMNLCSAYPFLYRGYIAGLLMVMRGKRERVADSKVHIMRLSRQVFSFLQGNSAIAVYENTFADIIGKPLLRMEQTVSTADDLGITVSFIMFSIKNIKRYRALFGIDDAERLIVRLREIIESRISHSDYGLRIESGKVIVVLQGKAKRFAVPFATTIRNELAASFKERDNQIMLSFLIAEYPADGKSVHEILDFLS
jgi:hypothetical protein